MSALNWKLILQLSMFGLAMAIATVFWISSNIEWIFWCLIFIVCAYIIAKKAPRKYFLHGFFVSLVNSAWITSAHIILFNAYAANHANEMAMMAATPMADSPRLMMAITGPVIGVISGIILGLFALGASKLVKK